MVAAAALLASAACGSGFDDNNNASDQQTSGPASLQILFGSSGDAETKALQDAAAWASSTGNTATVTPAQDLAQQLGQAFAGDSPPDVFYVDAVRFADYASVGALEPYAEKTSNVDDFYPALRQAFTYRGKLYCVPKDISTLAQKIKAKGIMPVAIGDTRDRIGAFMVQAGGRITNTDGQSASPAT